MRVQEEITEDDFKASNPNDMFLISLISYLRVNSTIGGIDLRNMHVV